MEKTRELKSRGKIKLDSGAVNAVVNKGASLLPAGIKSVTNRFKAGDAIDIIDAQNNKVIAKGITLYSHYDLKRIMGKHSNDIITILGHDYGDVVVHRDDMVIF